MANKNSTVKEEGIDFENLGIAQNQESDRYSLAERGAMSITKFRFDYKTKYWNELTKTGTPITKIDGIDTATGQIVKYYTVSSVIYKTMNEVMKKVGVVVKKDENNIEWMVLKTPVNIAGIEMVSTGVEGYNPYPKFKTNNK